MWEHAPSRIQLKATARMIFKVLHTPVPMYVVSPAELQKISDGKVIPRSLLDRPLLTTPSIEDFALGTDESLIAKEVDELPLVLKYIEDFKLQSLMTEEPSQPIAPSEPISEPQAVPVTVEQTTPNKKAGANKKTWDDKKLKALWEESIMPGVTNTSLAKKYGVSRQNVKGRKRGRVLVCNTVAQSIIEAQRGKHAEFVFPFRGHRVETMNNTAWQRARRIAGIPDLHIHDLRHTVGMRLREAGVREETIADILWHARQGMTAHYSVVQIDELVEALNRINNEGNRVNRSLAMIRREQLDGKSHPKVTIERKTG